MRPRRLLLASLLALSVATAVTPVASAMICGTDVWIGSLFGECRGWEPDECQGGITIVVLKPGGCDEGGCNGINVIVASPGSCSGGKPGESGCSGLTVIDPASTGSCQGEDALALVAALA